LDDKHKQWRKNCFDETLTNEVEQLKKEVDDKWKARLYWPETTLQGVTDYWLVTTPPYEAVEDARKGATLFIDKNGKMIVFEGNSFLIHCPQHKIPIIIDPTILTLHDAQTVQEEVWEIVRAEIVKRKDTIKGRDFAVPSKEPEALAPVFRCKPKTFIKYLRWYDLKKAGLTFRLIALI
jgi:hypothetical protein